MITGCLDTFPPDYVGLDYDHKEVMEATDNFIKGLFDDSNPYVRGRETRNLPDWEKELQKKLKELEEEREQSKQQNREKDMKKAEKDDILRITYYAKVNDNVVDHRYGRIAKCTNLETGLEFNLIGDSILGSLDSANYYETTEKVSLTKLFEAFDGVGANVFSVCFKKKDGTERVLRGYMVERETGMGRSMVIDLDIPKNDDAYDNRLRQVDHRELKWLIVGGKKFELK